MNIDQTGFSFNFSGTGSFPGAEELLHAQYLEEASRADRAFTFSRGISTDLSVEDFDKLIDSPTRRHRRGIGGSDLYLKDGMAVLLKLQSDILTIYVASADSAASKAEADRIADLVPRKPVIDSVVPMSVWHEVSSGASRKWKDVDCPSWDEVQPNYPKSEPLSELMKATAPTSDTAGKLILWYGPPGTGKTTALRAMARAWRKWCDVHIIADPERFFDSPGYLMEVGSPDISEGQRWRLVVAEDSDAFIHAKSGGAPAMGRLLNFADGILGQGARTLFLLTSNEPVDKLHEAIIRPGRCMAQIEFEKFTAHEAAQWLGPGYPRPAVAQSLADLMEHRNKDSKKILHAVEDMTVGQYL